MEWLTQQAQGAGGFIATFCLVVLGGACVILWKQLLFERSEHRRAEQSFTQATREVAVSHEKLSNAVLHLNGALTSVLPALVAALTERENKPRGR
jgi:hypothetical protein